MSAPIGTWPGRALALAAGTAAAAHLWTALGHPHGGGADAVMLAMVAGELATAWGTALWRSRLRTVAARAGEARSGWTPPTSASRPVRVSG